MEGPVMKKLLLLIVVALAIAAVVGAVGRES